MSIASILGGVGGKIVDSLDGLFTSDEERLAAQANIKSIINQGKKDARQAELMQERELTERMKLDMQSDSRLSKNIRPLTLAFLLIVVTVLAVTDGNLVWNEYEFEIGSTYISLYENLLMLVAAFYFGGRTVEKVQVGKRKKEEFVAEKQSTPTRKNKTANIDNDGFGPEED